MGLGLYDFDDPLLALVIRCRMNLTDGGYTEGHCFDPLQVFAPFGNVTVHDFKDLIDSQGRPLAIKPVELQFGCQFLALRIKAAQEDLTSFAVNRTKVVDVIEEG